MKASLLLILLAFNTILLAQFANEEAMDNQFAKKLEPWTNDFPEHSEIAVGMVKGGKFYYLGLKKTEEDVFRIENEEKYFEIGQMTQVFTTAILGHYVENGSISLDDMIKDKISMHIRLKVTFRQLATHSSGLDRNPTNFITMNWNSKNPWADYTEQLLREFFDAKVKLVAKPGTKYHESQIGMGLLGFCMKRIEAVDYKDLIQQVILDPNGMEKTTFELRPIQHEHATPYDGIGQKTDYWTFQRSIESIAGIRSTAKDMTKFMNSFFDPTNSHLAMCTESYGQIEEGVDTGLGWRIWNNWASHPVIYTEGRTSGFSCSMVVSIPKKTGIVFLSNQVTADLEDAIKEVAKLHIK